MWTASLLIRRITSTNASVMTTMDGSSSSAGDRHLMSFLDITARMAPPTPLSKAARKSGTRWREIFARVVLGIDHLPESLVEDPFDLELFKNPDITFPTNTADNINLVRVQAMRLKFHGQRAGRITVAIEDPKSKAGSVYDVIDDKLAEKHARLTTATILGVTLQAFMRDAEDKETIVPFKITAPATCDLGDTSGGAAFAPVSARVGDRKTCQRSGHGCLRGSHRAIRSSVSTSFAGGAGSNLSAPLASELCVKPRRPHASCVMPARRGTPRK